MITTTVARLVRFAVASVLLACVSLTNAATEHYLIDTRNAHAFIQFKVSHLGFSWILGTFNDFEGEFKLDKDKPENSSVEVSIDVVSLDTNHEKRDKHLRSRDFFEVEKFPKATFVSTAVETTGEKTGKITGDLTIKGITKPVTLDTTYIGGGADPFGMSVRRGFEATTRIRLKDFGITYKLPGAEYADLFITVEGILQ